MIMLQRKMQYELDKYYDDKAPQKILIIYGARQVGKSYIVRETAKKKFENYS